MHKVNRSRRTLWLAAILAVICTTPAAISNARAEEAGPPLSGPMEEFKPNPVGTTTPDNAVTAQGGTETTLAAYRGKLLLVNFWATWCGPCIRELPSLVRLAGRMKDAPLQIVALSIDFRGWGKIAPFLEDHGITGLTVLSDAKSRTYRALAAKGVPVTVLFDRQGRELGRLTGPAEWDSDEAVKLIRYYLAQSGR